MPPKTPLKVLSREDALVRKQVRFYTGVPCLHGHDSERYVGGGGCVQCQLLSQRGLLKDTPKSERFQLGFLHTPLGERMNPDMANWITAQVQKQIPRLMAEFWAPSAESSD